MSHVLSLIVWRGFASPFFFGDEGVFFIARGGLRWERFIALDEICGYGMKNCVLGFYLTWRGIWGKIKGRILPGVDRLCPLKATNVITENTSIFSAFWKRSNFGLPVTAPSMGSVPLLIKANLPKLPPIAAKLLWCATRKTAAPLAGSATNGCVVPAKNVKFPIGNWKNTPKPSFPNATARNSKTFMQNNRICQGNFKRSLLELPCCVFLP